MLKTLDYFRALKIFSFSNTTNLFDRLPRTKWYNSALNEFISYLALKPTDEILDVGCGPGWVTLWTSKQVDRAVGLDRSKYMIKRANHNLVSGKYNNSTFVEGDVMDMPFPNHMFDVVTGTMLLPVLAEPLKAIREMYRVLRPGGKLGLFVPSPALTNINAKQYAKENGLQNYDRDTLITWSLVGKRFSQSDLSTLFMNITNSDVKIKMVLGGMALICIVTK